MLVKEASQKVESHMRIRARSKDRLSARAMPNSRKVQTFVHNIDTQEHVPKVGNANAASK